MEEKNINNGENQNLEEKKETPTTSLLKKKKGTGGEDITSKLEKVVEKKEDTSKGGKTPLIVGLIVIVGIVVVLFFLLSGKSSIVKTGGSGITSGGSDYVEMKIVETTKEGKKIIRTKIVKKTELEKVKKELASKTPNVQIKVKELTKKEVEQKKKEIATETPVEGVKGEEGGIEEKKVESASGEKESGILTENKSKEMKEPVSKKEGMTKENATQPATVSPSVKPIVKKVVSTPVNTNTNITKKKIKEGDLVPLDSSVEPPKLLKKYNIPKPAKARFSGRGGRVILRILIDENGNVTKAKVISEIPRNFGFGSAALKGVKRFRFSPAKKEGVRVKVWKTLVIKF